MFYLACWAIGTAAVLAVVSVGARRVQRLDPGRLDRLNETWAREGRDLGRSR